jgi:hypothetical protein
MLAGLISRWTIPLACAASSASAISIPKSSTCSSGSGLLEMRCFRVVPSSPLRTPINQIPTEETNHGKDWKEAGTGQEGRKEADACQAGSVSVKTCCAEASVAHQPNRETGGVSLKDDDGWPQPDPTDRLVYSLVGCTRLREARHGCRLCNLPCANPSAHCSLAYSALASFRIGMSGFFQRVRKSL